MTFNLDIAIVAGYMVFCLVIGFFKYGTIKNIRDYTLGVKPFSTPVLLATTFATAISARHIIGHVGKVYELGLIFIIPLFFIPISWLIFVKIVMPNLPVFRKHKFLSLSELMAYWYGESGRWTCNIISIIRTIAATAMSGIAIGYLLHYFLKIPEIIGMIMGIVIVASYSLFGGIASVAFTDVFQFLVFFTALPAACIIGYQKMGGMKEAWFSLPRTHTHISDITLFISFIFFALMPIADIPFIQRALIAKNKKQFLQSFIGVAILLVPLIVIVCLIGLITYHNTPSIIGADKILYYFVDQHLPIGIKGLMIAGMLAIIMSTQDSYLNTTSVLISHDICKQIWSSLSNRQELFIARISCIVISIVSLSVILVKKDIISIIWLVNNLTMPLITVPMVAGLINTRINKRAFIFVVLTSLFAVTVTRFLTGIFDTRSITVGIITSTIFLYILHKKHKKENLLSLPKINMNLLFDKLNARVLNNSFSIGSLYTVGIIICFNLNLGMFFTDLSYFNILNCSLIIIASLLILLLLNEFWHHNLKNYIGDIWRFSLIIGLAFIPSYIMFANDFHILWLCNFVLSVILFLVMTDFVVGTAFTLIATSVSYLLPQIFYNDSDLISTGFAGISCSLILIAIIIQFYNRHSITKSAHKEIMHELKNIMQERISESLNVKEEFLNKLNHELRIPLSVMINTSDGIYQMWDRLSDKKKKEYLKDIVDNRSRFENYTSNILDLADLKQKRFKLDIKSNIDLVKLSKNAIDRATQIIIDKNKNLKIKLELKKTKSAIINCDEARISQALDNLLSNSIKFSNSGIIKVLIHPTKNDIAISISDQGVGVPKNERSKIFEPFFEGSRTKSPAEGKGLGLSVAQQIIILHKGSIRVEDNKPKGTIFTAVLPINTINQ